MATTSTNALEVPDTQTQNETLGRSQDEPPPTLERPQGTEGRLTEYLDLHYGIPRDEEDNLQHDPARFRVATSADLTASVNAHPDEWLDTLDEEEIQELKAEVASKAVSKGNEKRIRDLETDLPVFQGGKTSSTRL